LTSAMFGLILRLRMYTKTASSSSLRFNIEYKSSFSRAILVCLCLFSRTLNLSPPVVNSLSPSTENRGSNGPLVTHRPRPRPARLPSSLFGIVFAAWIALPHMTLGPAFPPMDEHIPSRLHCHHDFGGRQSTTILSTISYSIEPEGQNQTMGKP